MIIPTGRGEIRNHLLQNDSDANVIGKINPKNLPSELPAELHVDAYLMFSLQWERTN